MINTFYEETTFLIDVLYGTNAQDKAGNIVRISIVFAAQPNKQEITHEIIKRD
jgi:hypothetical protein